MQAAYLGPQAGGTQATFLGPQAGGTQATTGEESSLGKCGLPHDMEWRVQQLISNKGMHVVCVCVCGCGCVREQVRVCVWCVRVCMRASVKPAS